jgi:hypothetical protein
MIDVFIRQNYTADSNAMMVGFLSEFSEAEAAIGNTTGAAALQVCECSGLLCPCIFTCCVPAHPHALRSCRVRALPSCSFHAQLPRLSSSSSLFTCSWTKNLHVFPSQRAKLFS